MSGKPRSERLQRPGRVGIFRIMNTARRPLLAAALSLSGLALAGAPLDARAQEARPLAVPPGDGAAALIRLVERLRALEEDGLDPRQYGIPDGAQAASDPAGYRAGLHRASALALTDLLVGRVRDLPGRVDFRRDLSGIMVDRWLAELAQTPDPAAVLDRAALLPEGQAALKAELVRQKHIAQRGTGVTIPGDATIEPGSFDTARVPALRARLAVEDLVLAGSPDTGPRYDAVLEAAVKRWQAAQGLEVDGRVGRISIALLNRPLSARVDQIRVALDMNRARAGEGGERRIDVNIPDYRLQVLEDGRELRSMAVTVGRRDRATPMLRVRMTALQFNPPWGVPERNLREDLLPRFRRDPQAMIDKGFRVFGMVDGQRQEIDARTIDWSSINPQRIPYFIRQDAGDFSALGRIKFIMPNNDDIYLHDTPDRHLFRRPDRAFSSGCIRLERPNDMLAMVLDGTPGWDLPRALRAIEARNTSGVALRRSLPVLLRYDTVTVEAGGRVRVRPDVYDLDAVYARALRAPRPVQVAAR